MLVLSVGTQWWYSVVVPSGGTKCWYSVVVLSGGTQWWCPVVVLSVGTQCWYLKEVFGLFVCCFCCAFAPYLTGFSSMILI